MEQWKDIHGCEGLYQVSSLGRVRSLPRTIIDRIRTRRLRGRLLSPGERRDGYRHVVLCNQEKGMRVTSIHRLIALHFISAIEGKTYVNHKNGVKTDNMVENLEWCTQRENIKHSFDSLGRIPKSTPVVQESTKGRRIKVFPSGVTAANETGISKTRISAAVTGQAKTAGGYRWRYLNDTEDIL